MEVPTIHQKRKFKREGGLGEKGDKCNSRHAEFENLVEHPRGEVHLQTHFCAFESHLENDL